jgi:hypothetical protein
LPVPRDCRRHALFLDLLLKHILHAGKTQHDGSKKSLTPDRRP